MSFSKPKHEVADLFREHRHRLENLTQHQNKIIDAIIYCRTEAMGGHIYRCDNLECGNEEQAYNSCRNRNCPKCQYSAKELWVEERVKELLPVPYFHVVFTVPDTLNSLILYNRVELFSILFKASQRAVKKVMKKSYNATPGMISLLHSWGSNVSFHPHIHMLLAGGGIHLDEDRWVNTKESYCLPVKASRRCFERSSSSYSGNNTRKEKSD